MKQFNINPQQATQAWGIAKQMGAGIKTKEQAMRMLAEKGIDQNALAQIGSYINSPMADVLGGAMGVNITKVRQDFNSLVNNAPSNDLLAKYKNGLRQV